MTKACLLESHRGESIDEAQFRNPNSAQQRVPGSRRETCEKRFGWLTLKGCDG